MRASEAVPSNLSSAAVHRRGVCLIASAMIFNKIKLAPSGSAIFKRRHDSVWVMVATDITPATATFRRGRRAKGTLATHHPGVSAAPTLNASDA
jgi:hypothetical protein